MTQPNTTEKIPAPVYAAAGVGDMAYQQLRKLPARVVQLRERVTATGERELKVDVDKLRATARRNAAAVLTGAQAAQQRATSFYQTMVVRGQQVVRNYRDAGPRDAQLTAPVKATVITDAGPVEQTVTEVTTPATPKARKRAQSA